MGNNVVQKILKNHLLKGELVIGKEISIRIDQTLTQDATGTMAWLQFESMGLSKVKNELAVSYIDHNTLQSGFMNPDDHVFLQTAAAKYGAHFSKPGNGICHQLHLERFGKPGTTLLGSDSHTPTAGGLAMIAMGAGGLDIACAMAGAPYYLKMPSIIEVRLLGELSPFVSSKDIILELLRRLSVKGGVNKIFEYTGDGLKTLSVPERATITNMGAELGATTSVFPSDENTLEFLRSQDRKDDYIQLIPDKDACYDETIEIDLSELEPMIAKPHMPDQVVKVKEIENLRLDQICIGSCTNSSYQDLMKVVNILKDKKVHKDVSVILSPGSRQVCEMLCENGGMRTLHEAGIRIIEPVCGPCIGMGSSPPSNGNTLRTFNRNFKGRSGTQDAKIYLASPEVAAVSALRGKLTDPRDAGIEHIKIEMPRKMTISGALFIPPKNEDVTVIKGPNIKEVPLKETLENDFFQTILLKVKDDITTDDIMPAGAKVLPLRSNIPAIAEFVFSQIDPDFAKRAKENTGGIIIGGLNYGQGSSREHAALAPMYLGIKAVITKSFARIHHSNLINFGILPLVFVNEEDYNKTDQGDILVFKNVIDSLNSNSGIKAENTAKNISFELKYTLSEREIEIIKAGGLLGYTKEKVLEN
ncbi:aconitate hydratase [Elusimicrobiota bacterium]